MGVPFWFSGWAGLCNCLATDERRRTQMSGLERICRPSKGSSSVLFRVYLWPSRLYSWCSGMVTGGLLPVLTLPGCGSTLSGMLERRAGIG